MLLLGDQARKGPRTGSDVVAQADRGFGGVALLGSADGHDEIRAVVVRCGEGGVVDDA